MKTYHDLIALDFADELVSNVHSDANTMSVVSLVPNLL